MKIIQFVTGKPVEDAWGYGRAEYTPVYAILNNKKKLVCNITRPLSGDSQLWMNYQYNESIRDTNNAKINLMHHDGKYITFYAMMDNPFYFINWIKEKGYTLEAMDSLFRISNSKDFVDFQGNASEYSCSFFYRIYDDKMLQQLKKSVSGLKVNIR